MQATLLRKSLFDVLDRVQSSGEPVEIVRFKRPVATLVPGVRPRNKKPLLDLDAISAFCRKHQVRSFALFGSILTDDFRADSDVDVLLDSSGTFLDFHVLLQMKRELETMFGREVDLLTTDDLNLDQMNPVRLEAIKRGAKIVYEQS